MQRMRRRELQPSSVYKQRGLFTLQKNRNMIQFVTVIFKEIFDQGRNFPWDRPPKSPKYNSFKVWGHGFVPAYFDHFDTPVLLKRSSIT